VKKNWIFIGIIGSLFLVNCERQREAIGGVDDIYVYSTDTIRAALQQAIDTTFSYGLRTPEFQPYYRVKWTSLEDFPNRVYYRNIILIADLDCHDLAYDIVHGLLPEKSFQAADKDSLNMFAIPDNWAKDQMFVIIAGHDIKTIERSILEQKGWLYAKFEQKFEEEQFDYLYYRMEQVKLTNNFWQKYRWTMRIPRDFVIVKEIPERNFVWLGRGLPYRWISVSWQDGIQTEWLTTNGLYNKRNQIGELYGSNMTEKRFLGFQFTKFGEYDALKMYGLWYHNEETKGGPFETYAFYDWRTDRTFVIDMIMFAPGEKVSVTFRTLEIIAKTFTTDYTGNTKKGRG